MEKIVDDTHIKKVNKVIIISLFVAIVMHLGYVLFNIVKEHNKSCIIIINYCDFYFAR